MKNIVLLGTPKSGKRMFVKMLLEKYHNYNLLDGDLIGLGYQRSVIEKAFEESEDDKMKFALDFLFATKVSEKIFRANTEYFNDLGFIFKSHFLSLEYAKEYLNKDSIVLVFGYPNASVNHILANWRLYSTKNDFNYGLSFKEQKKLAEDYIDISKYNCNEAKRLGLKFVDTSSNKEEALEDLLRFVDKEIYNTN